MTELIHPANGVEAFLARAESVIHLSPDGFGSPSPPSPGDLRVGVDLGTAYLVMVAVDESGEAVAGEYQFSQVVRDGLVVDFFQAVDLLSAMKQRLEKRLQRKLTHAATGYPPGVPQTEVRATAHVVESAGLECSGTIAEPSAANNLLQIRDGAIVDVGGGTTGIAIIRDGKVVYTADEATGGTHFSLVIAGAFGISFEEAEKLKTDPSQQTRLFPVVRPVMEKVGSIVQRHIRRRQVHHLTLVGGSTAFPGMADVISEYTGLPTHSFEHPMFITPLGIAMHDNPR